MKVLTALALLSVLGGCSEQRERPPAAKKAGDDLLRSWTDAENVGRFQYHPANGEMPALVFDTATGCMEVIERWTLEENPKAIVWVRKTSDQVMKGTPQRCSPERSTGK